MKLFDKKVVNIVIGKPERPTGLRLKALATNRYGFRCWQGSRRRSSGGRSLVVVLVQGVLRRARSEVVRPGLTSSHQLVRKTRSQTKKGKGKHLRQKVLSQSCSVGELETSQKSKQKKLTVFMARVELKVRFPGQWLLLYVAAEEGNARVPDLSWGGRWNGP